MKVIEAFWEKRNLGLTAVEIIVDQNDQPEAVSKQLADVVSNYTVVKLPIGRADISFMLAEFGFAFIETMSHLTHDLKPVRLDENRFDITKHLNLIPVKDNDLDYIIKRIRAGMFITDRISLDPFFTIDQAANRYVGWLKDELNRKAEIFNVVYKKQYIGFVGLKRTGDGYHNFLYGIYDEFAGRSFAVYMMHNLIDEVRKRNAKFLSTDVSSNNIASLKTMLKSGFLISETTYVFVKHNLGKKEVKND